MKLYHYSTKKFVKFSKIYFRQGQGGSADTAHYFGGNRKSALYWMSFMESKKGYLYTVDVPVQYVNKDFVMDDGYVECTVDHKNEKFIKIVHIEKVKINRVATNAEEEE